jgi:hypothetical protein
MGYQLTRRLVILLPRPNRTRPSQGGLLSTAAPPQRASPARHEFDSRMGYQLRHPSLATSRVHRTRPSQGGLLSSAAPPQRASPARHESDSRMGYQIPFSPVRSKPRPGRDPLKVAYFDARLRRGALHRRDTSSILVWATRSNRLVLVARPPPGVSGPFLLRIAAGSAASQLRGDPGAGRSPSPRTFAGRAGRPRSVGSSLKRARHRPVLLPQSDFVSGCGAQQPAQTRSLSQ